MWIHEGKEVSEIDLKRYKAFVYCIENLDTHKRYIGKKTLHSTRTRKVNNKRKKVVSESDWRNYYGSNEELLKDVKELGKDKFRREILHLCVNKGSASYLEAREQFERRVLENPEEYYNRWIMIKVHHKHLKLE